MIFWLFDIGISFEGSTLVYLQVIEDKLATNL